MKRIRDYSIRGKLTFIVMGMFLGVLTISNKEFYELTQSTLARYHFAALPPIPKPHLIQSAVVTILCALAMDFGLFLAHYLDGRDPQAALGRTAGAVYSVLKATTDSGSAELALVAAQEELVNPRHTFEAVSL